VGETFPHGRMKKKFGGGDVRLRCDFRVSCKGLKKGI